MASSARVFGNKCRALMATAKSAAAATATATATAAKPKRATGILKVQSVSPALAKFLGSPEASRSGAIKKVWDTSNHIIFRIHPTREIYCDDSLKAIFDGKDKVNFQG